MKINKQYIYIKQITVYIMLIDTYYGLTFLTTLYIWSCFIQIDKYISKNIIKLFSEQVTDFKNKLYIPLIAIGIYNLKLFLFCTYCFNLLELFGLYYHYHYTELTLISGELVPLYALLYAYKSDNIIAPGMILLIIMLSKYYNYLHQLQSINNKLTRSTKSVRNIDT